MIEHATSKSSGEYECLADNQIESKLSKIITINVRGKSKQKYIQIFAREISFDSQAKCGANEKECSFDELYASRQFCFRHCESKI